MCAAQLPRPGVWPLAALILTASACGRTAPSAANGASVLRHQLALEGNGIVRLLSFVTSGGQRSTFLGVTWYSMDYRAQIEFLREACYGGGLSARDYVPPRYDPSGLPASDDLASACHRVHVLRGERREVAGSLPFEKVREGGWRGPDGRLY